jgi:hypothetical protein
MRRHRCIGFNCSAFIRKLLRKAAIWRYCRSANGASAWLAVMLIRIWLA